MGWQEVELPRAYRLFYPVVPVVVSAAHEDKVGGMPAISCMPVSFDPFLVALSISPTHRTYKLIEASGHYALNWLDFKHHKKIECLAEPTGPAITDKLKACGLTPLKARATPAVVIGEAAAVIECAVREARAAGDHVLLISEAVVAYASSDFGEYWRFGEYAPTLYVGEYLKGGGKFTRFRV